MKSKITHYFLNGDLMKLSYLSLLLLLSIGTCTLSCVGMQAKKTTTLTQSIEDKKWNDAQIVQFIKANGFKTEEPKSSKSDDTIEIYRYEEPLNVLGITLLKRVYSVPVEGLRYKKYYELQTRYFVWSAMAALVAYQLYSYSKAQEPIAAINELAHHSMPPFCL